MSAGVTLTATIVDNSGSPVVGKLVITLNNFGGVPPRVTGSDVIANQVYTALANGSGVCSATIWGNYQITPASTYYEIAVYGTDANGNVSNAPNSCGNYSFTAGGTFDLSNLVPI